MQLHQVLDRAYVKSLLLKYLCSVCLEEHNPGNTEMNLEGSIVDKASAYSAKRPGFTTRWRQQFINVHSVLCILIEIKLQLEPT